MENTCKVDKRIRRTKKILTEALIEILKEKNVMDVTVSELAKKADVTRTTFYQYYRDPVSYTHLDVYKRQLIRFWWT